MKCRIFNKFQRKLTVLAFFVCVALIWNLRLATNSYIYRFHQHETESNTLKTKCNSTKAKLSMPSEELMVDTWFIHHKDKMMSDPVLRRFLPRMSINDQLLMLVTLDTFVEICNRANLTYFLWSGSLLGAYRHHGFIPWDDDLDVAIVISDVNRTRSALSNHSEYELLSPKNFQWKLYLKELPTYTKYKFKYPFIDIFLFEENSTHIFGWAENIKEFVYNKEDIFPLQLRWFESRLLSTPCNVEHLVQSYDTDRCVSLYYLHKHDVYIDYSTVTCDMLYDVFPFVFRQNGSQSGSTVEVLKRGDQILREVSVVQNCKAVSSSHKTG